MDGWEWAWTGMDGWGWGGARSSRGSRLASLLCNTAQTWKPPLQHSSNMEGPNTALGCKF
eukprot:146826-Chlamydomonas_euryale.AAC.1